MTKIQQLGLIGNSNRLFIKRDDLLPFSFGGNKARKAELFFRDIEDKKADYVVTYGSGSSNHCCVIANASATRDLPCLIISPEETEQNTLNFHLMHLFGASIVICPVAKVSEIIEQQMKRLTIEGYHPYFIQGGGHGNIGTQAYVDCFDEIAEYEEANRLKFEYIFLASGTGTTQAGLVSGKILHKSKAKIVGISIARRNPYGGDVVCKSVSDYMTAQGLHGDFYDEVEFVDDYIAGGYGGNTPEIIDTVKNVICKYGIPLSMTYTGKAFWGMQEYLIAHQIEEKNIMFIHTGGVPLFFDDLEKLL